MEKLNNLQNKFVFDALEMLKLIYDEYGGIGTGIAAGIALMIIFGWIPIIGPITAGMVAGILTKDDAGRGALAGFLSGVIGATIESVLLTTLGFAFLGSLGAFIGGLASLTALISLPLFGLIGGLIGGVMVRRKR
jgi:uncharacterized membrane protein YeaQ/YmgE (transglycosylase-associated protein family)